jgi:hypothetical protein
VRWIVSRTGVVIILLLLATPSLAASADSGSDLTLLLYRTQAVLAGEWQAPGELTALAAELAPPESLEDSGATDQRLARRAFRDACARLLASLGDFELAIEAGHGETADRLYREKVLPLLFDLTVCRQVLDGCEQQRSKAR